MNNLRKLYNKLELDKMLEIKLPTWIPLLDTRQMFDRQNFVLALRYISQVIEDEKMLDQQFIQSEV